MPSVTFSRFGTIGLGVALAALALGGCSKTPSNDTTSPSAMETPAVNDGGPAGNETAAAPAGAPAADDTATLDGSKLASFTGDAAKGELVFVACKACHAENMNVIGPMLKGVVGRKAATVAGFAYSDPMKNSGITWTPEKLFQFIEKPSRVVPGTRMTFPGQPDPQQRAGLIAYLKSQA